jgi:hypothetical protein
VLAKRRELGDRPLAKFDRRQIGDVGRGPHRDDPGQRAGRRRVDVFDAPMGIGRTHQAQVQLVRKRHVAGKAAAPDDQRRVFEPFDRGADPAFRFDRHARAFMSAAAARTALTMFS